jgi:MFS transporter, ACS family, hexuronate transporter
MLMGPVPDSLASRRGMGLAVTWWSVAAILHGAVVGVKTPCLFRALLAIGEAASISGRVKAIAEWFNPKQRGVAIGAFETGPSLAPIIAPPMLVRVALRYSWREAFVWTGIMGLVWAIPWMLFCRVPTALTPGPESAEKLTAARAAITLGGAAEISRKRGKLKGQLS